MKYMALTDLSFKNCEVRAGGTFKVKNSAAIEPLIKQELVKSVRAVIAGLYSEHCRWLKSHSLTAEDIKNHNPELLQAIHRAITEMDKCFINDDLNGFKEARQMVENLYMRAFKQNRF
jgi:prephenate dehydrogenase